MGGDVVLLLNYQQLMLIKRACDCCLHASANLFRLMCMPIN